MESRVTRILQAQEPGGPTTLTLENGEQLKTGYVIDAISRASPTSSYLPLGAVDKEGYVKINSQYAQPSLTRCVLHS